MATVGGLLFAYVVRFLAAAFYPVRAGLERIPVSLDESARSLGAGAARTLREIHAPLLKTSILTALILVVVEVIKEMPVTMLMRPFGFDTLAVEIWQRTTESLWVEAAPPALTIVVLSACLVAFLTRLYGVGGSDGGRAV
jgi:iron(III) transport system permease protein